MASTLKQILSKEQHPDFTRKQNKNWRLGVIGMVILSAIVLGFIIYYIYYYETQNFVVYEDPDGFPRKYSYGYSSGYEPEYSYYCDCCTKLDRASCNRCSNCTYCYSPNRKGECVAGNKEGPLFRKDCIVYEHLGKTTFEGAYKDNVLGLHSDNSERRMLLKSTPLAYPQALPME